VEHGPYGSNILMTPQPREDVISRVDVLLADAVERGASDIHLTPARAGTDVRLRIDGMLGPAMTLPTELGRAAVMRLMVMAKLLTYRLDVPQEGRAGITLAGGPIELRISVIPTVHGLRCAVRLPAVGGVPETLDELGLSPDTLAGLRRFVASDGGLLIVTGPAGSGKTTTVYSLLRHFLANRPELSIVSLEDPVEREVSGVAQVEVSSFGQLTYERAVRSILRQDPQVLALGEVRDAATASVAVAAALSGHRLICTMHAGSAGGAVARLIEMGIEPYQITSALAAVLNQRLVRRRVGDRYAGRVPIAAWTTLDAATRRAILDRADADALDTVVLNAGAATLEADARRLIGMGVTDAAEVARVLGEARPG
jgi:type II secretory ATPase GspE/PulE/Tfp pilus assembly ATPase PilB-like protein